MTITIAKREYPTEDESIKANLIYENNQYYIQVVYKNTARTTRISAASTEEAIAKFNKRSRELVLIRAKQLGMF